MTENLCKIASHNQQLVFQVDILLKNYKLYTSDTSDS